MSATTTKGAKTRAEEKLRAFHEEGQISQSYDIRMLRRLWPFVRPHSLFVVLSLITLVLLTAVNLERPRLMANVVEKAGDRDAQGLFIGGALLAGLLVLMQMLTFAQMYMMQLAGARAMADLRSTIFRFFQRLQLRFYDRTPVGRLVTRATNDVDAVNELFASGVINALGDLLSLAGIIVLMLAKDVQLSLVAFCAVPLVGAIVNFVRSRSRAAYRDIRAKTARLNAFLNEQVSGIAVVQAFGREHAMATEFNDINYAFRDANKRSIYYEAILDASIEMVSTVGVASILWWSGIQRFGSHAVTFPIVVMFTQYVKQFFEPISLLSQRYTVLQSAMSGAERIFQFLDEKEVDSDKAAPGELAPEGPPDEAVCLEHVFFEYKPDVPVLRDVSLRAKRGGRVALVGATGAGKTTVASILLRLYDVRSGIVRVLGKDVRSYGLTELREQFSVVPQDVFLFAGTVLSNIAMSDDGTSAFQARLGAPPGSTAQRGPHQAASSRAKAEQALRRIGSLELFMRREGGLDAHVDERGANFSAGERQLLAFARAIYRDAPILILDEATASVDSDTEMRLQLALEAAMKGRTTLAIAHRLSTIRAADHIVVFHKGQVVETGTHDQLLAADGVYARLYRMQFAHERADSLKPGPVEVDGTSTALPQRGQKKDAAIAEE